jgi:hypothetical protein
MYAGSTLKAFKYLDAWFGAHQKIDRVARKNLDALIDGASFPANREIVRFEGIDGPDGIKRKSPGADEPWHFYDPHNPADVKLLSILDYHRVELIRALQEQNKARTAFEAAWLAHAVVDGLTPAHHYPYEAELAQLRGGASRDTRDSVKGKLVLPGDTLREQVRHNWQMWGDKGLMATHLAFEWGVAIMSVPLRLTDSLPLPAEVARYRQLGLTSYFQATAAEIAALDIYSEFYKTGWTPKLGRVVRRELMPRIVRVVTLAWYDAVAASR